MDKEITLTDQERLNYFNQFKILQLLEPENKDYYQNFITILSEGYEYHYSDIFEGIFSETLSNEQCKFVLDVLEMYRGIIYSYDAIIRDGKSTSLTKDKIRFPGFDGNHECSEMRYVRYFLDDLDRYGEIQAISSYYNSHSQMIPRYKRMLGKWEEYKNLPNRYMMNEEEIYSLINVR